MSRICRHPSFPFADSGALTRIDDAQKELVERRAQAARREYTLRLAPKDLLQQLEALDQARASLTERQCDISDDKEALTHHDFHRYFRSGSRGFVAAQTPSRYQARN